MKLVNVFLSCLKVAAEGKTGNWNWNFGVFAITEATGAINDRIFNRCILNIYLWIRRAIPRGCNWLIWLFARWPYVICGQDRKIGLLRL
ncbi:MAG: hypothetical protein OCU20_09795 [Methanophagales archaeon]|nr:hypothetical protein [Methanophagales archaeon]